MRRRVWASRAPNGSSSRSSGGRLARTWAMAARWRMPPESWRGSRSAEPLRPVASSSSSTTAAGPSGCPGPAAPTRGWPAATATGTGWRPGRPSAARATAPAPARRPPRPGPGRAAPGRPAPAAGSTCRTRSGPRTATTSPGADRQVDVGQHRAGRRRTWPRRWRRGRHAAAGLGSVAALAGPAVGSVRRRPTAPGGG